MTCYRASSPLLAATTSATWRSRTRGAQVFEVNDC